MILSIAGTPRRHYYSRTEDLAHVPAGEPSHQLLDNPGVVRSAVDGEYSNLVCLLRLPARKWLASPPLGVVAVLSDAGVALYAGEVVTVSWTAEGASVEIQP